VQLTEAVRTLCGAGALQPRVQPRHRTATDQDAPPRPLRAVRMLSSLRAAVNL